MISVTASVLAQAPAPKMSQISQKYRYPYICLRCSRGVIFQRPGHNLDRCRTQFKIVADMEREMDSMTAIIEKYSRF